MYTDSKDVPKFYKKEKHDTRYREAQRFEESLRECDGVFDFICGSVEKKIERSKSGTSGTS
ncbi:MAG: hypothetical protein LBB24_02755, partial [Rickettsiales bacterium]|nr:hypothetical protein [Rickettsiales bacterium]